MSPLPTEQLPPPGQVGGATHGFLGLCVIACAAFGAWAFIGTLDIVSMAMGEVIPSSQVKSIAHLEGGIVRKISVREGQRVKKGQPLVELEPTSSGADLGELKVRLASLDIEVARLEAEATGVGAPKFTAQMEKISPDLVKKARGLFEARRKALKGRFNTQREAIDQRRQSIQEITARMRNTSNSLTLLAEKIAISEELLKEDLTNRFQHLDLLKEQSNLKGRNEEDAAALRGARSALKEAQSKLESITDGFREEASKELEAAQLNLKELSQRLQKFEDSVQRTVLRSPVDGVVKTLHISTRGGVVRAGDTVIDIVPAGDRLVIEARLPTQDIGYVQTGQKAMVKLASADARRFGSLPGKVINVSPDTLISEKGVPFYKVRIETESDHFARGKLKYQLFPGMQVIADVQTGSRTVFEYLAGPFLTSMTGAMRER